jgi:DNA-binding transcriptional ArsR family regulator
MASAGEIFRWPGKKFWDRDPGVVAPAQIMDFLESSPVATVARIKTTLGMPLENVQSALSALVRAGRGNVLEPGNTPYYCLSEPLGLARRAILSALADGPLTAKDLASRIKNTLPGYQLRHLKEHIAHIEPILEHPGYGKEKTRYGLEPPKARPYVGRAAREIRAVQKILAPFDVSLEGILEALRTELGLDPRPPADPKESKDGRPRADAEHLLLEGIGRLQPLAQRRALVSIRELRRFLGISKEDFDRAVFSLARQGRVALHQHDFPASLGPAERDELLRDEQGIFYVGIVPKEKS